MCLLTPKCQGKPKAISGHLTLTRTPLGHLAEGAPLEWGGGQILPPCLTRERVAVARRAWRQSKFLDEYF